MSQPSRAADRPDTALTRPVPGGARLPLGTRQHAGELRRLRRGAARRFLLTVATLPKIIGVVLSSLRRVKKGPGRRPVSCCWLPPLAADRRSGMPSFLTDRRRRYPGRAETALAHRWPAGSQNASQHDERMAAGRDATARTRR